VIILGIDPASVRCGYGLIRADGLRVSYVEAGVLTAPESWTKYARLAEIGKEIVAILGEHVVDAVAIEAGFIVPFRRKDSNEVYSQQGALVSAAARGMAGYIAASRGIQVFEYAPAAVKKCVTGEGNADKAQVARAIQLRLGMKAEPAPDAADALSIAVCHAMQAAIGRRKAA
jgi:crossover junction endodeoxyribonuclease RuvC